ncbi:6-carboxytetrahydropterin synthase [Myxococcaceae bacterium GXIMD 01537]
MVRRTRIELFKEEMKFSAGHFTIFSATHRENLHGHNFFIHVETEADVFENGLAFDYGMLKKRLIDLCHGLNETFLLPASSPHLRLEQTETHVLAFFAGEQLTFLRRDVKVLPVRNVTLEELAGYLLEDITHDWTGDAAAGVRRLIVKVFSGPGQLASAERVFT